MKHPLILLADARTRLRRVESRLRRYPHDDRLRRLRREGHFRITELEQFVASLLADDQGAGSEWFAARIPPAPASDAMAALCEWE